MTQPSWTANGAVIQAEQTNRLKFMIAGGLILIAIIALIVQALTTSGQYFITVAEYYENPAKYSGRDVNIGAWVVPDTIKFTQVDAATSILEFDVVDDLVNPGQRLHIIAENEPIPDTMQGSAEQGTEPHDVQALVEGEIQSDGMLYANPNGLKTKCPSRYEDGVTPEL